ncbi:MAG TPA: GGDEF domain-containing protein [Arenimonas sp.]|uniref:GGDEF domain-containing protein n=1 Tax=Arenimonas sp. TaxID=1872635 RepID=UPI002D7F4BE3|nr:GGDEF domain-containing protein [Arenimonas sp.]HEU0152039.1 GGDEF domain-containing protein [Arenimonas sp.]
MTANDPVQNAAPALTARSLLRHAFEGEVAGLPAHERREQYRRQIQLLHAAMSNLLLGMTVLAAVVALAESLINGALSARLAWQAAGVAALAVMAWRYRHVVSIRRRRVLGSVFGALLLACLALPTLRWPGQSLLPMAVFLLLPVTWLPLLVRPHMTFGGLAVATAVVGALAWQSPAPAGELGLFAFYYALATAAGLLLRRARSNLATRLDRRVETLWQRAVSDPLTGLLNREGWMNLAGTALAEATEAGQVPAVLFIDVDYFKRTNDQHGHLVGDQLLVMLGEVLAARIGTGEYCARLGGEEFACLLPGASLDHARRFAERLGQDYRLRASEFGSTLSIGIATWRPGDVLNDLLAQADAALYQAKREGRDRIVVANSV